MIKSMGCSCCRPRISVQHPYDGSHLPVTSVSVELMPSSGLCRRRAQAWHTNKTFVFKMLMHNKYIVKIKNK